MIVGCWRAGTPANERSSTKQRAKRRPPHCQPWPSCRRATASSSCTTAESLHQPLPCPAHAPCRPHRDFGQIAPASRTARHDRPQRHTSGRRNRLRWRRSVRGGLGGGARVACARCSAGRCCSPVWRARHGRPTRSERDPPRRTPPAPTAARPLATRCCGASGRRRRTAPRRRGCQRRTAAANSVFLASLTVGCLMGGCLPCLPPAYRVKPVQRCGHTAGAHAVPASPQHVAGSRRAAVADPPLCPSPHRPRRPPRSKLCKGALAAKPPVQPQQQHQRRQGSDKCVRAVR